MKQGDNNVFWLSVQYISLTWYLSVYFVRLLGVFMHVSRVNICVNSATRRAQPAPSITEAGVGVTILRPMLGSDSNLYECLRSSFIQSYEKFEIILCVADPADPAIEVAQRLVNEFPKIDAKILIGMDNYGINPKVCNLVKGYKNAKYDTLWVLDSNVSMNRYALQRAVPLLKGRVQLVHHLPIAYASTQPSRYGGLLDEVYMLTAHSTFYSGINAVGIAPCVTGKSNIYRRSDLDSSTNSSFGCGFQQFAKYMAEDQMISESLWAHGGRTAIAADGAVQPLGDNVSVREFWRRRSRWIRLRKYMVTSATLVEPFTDCFFGTIVFSYLNGYSFSAFFGLCVFWMLIDLANYRILLGYTQQSCRGTLQWAVIWLSREIIAFPLWLWAMSGRRIWWRNHFYKINPDLEAVNAD